MAAAQKKIRSKYQKTVKNSIFGFKKLRQILMAKDKSYMLCLPQDYISSIFGPVIPSKQPKNAKIGKNRLFLGDFGFQNKQICQIMH